MNEQMESLPGSKPNPDPTLATIDAVERGDRAERDYVDGQLQVRDERLAGIDEATKLRLAGIEGIPNQITEKVSNLEKVVNEKFASVQTQFEERDTRSERESRDNAIKVDAAFAAQKEAAAKQETTFAGSIDKSERATEKTIDALDEKVDDLKDRVVRIESIKQGGQESRNEGRASRGELYAAIAAASVIAGLVGHYIN